MGCESYLHTSYFTLEVFPTNYVVYRKDRSISDRGVFVAIKDDLTSSHELILSASAELVWTKLFIVGMKPLYICSYYRPPYSDLEPLVELKNSLSSLLNGKSVPPHLVVTGDFNLLDTTWTETGGRLISNPTYGSVLNNTFLNILDDFSLEQLVLSPTRGNHILDLILPIHPSDWLKENIIPIHPSDWLKENIIPIHKKGDRSVPANYRPISSTLVCCKVMEHIIFHSCMSHLESNDILGIQLANTLS